MMPFRALEIPLTMPTIMMAHKARWLLQPIQVMEQNSRDGICSALLQSTSTNRHDVDICARDPEYVGLDPGRLDPAREEDEGPPSAKYIAVGGQHSPHEELEGGFGLNPETVSDMSRMGLMMVHDKIMTAFETGQHTQCCMTRLERIC